MAIDVEKLKSEILLTVDLMAYDLQNLKNDLINSLKTSEKEFQK